MGSRDTNESRDQKPALGAKAWLTHLLKNSTGQILSYSAVALVLFPFIFTTLYQNFYFALGLLCFVLSWIYENWKNGYLSSTHRDYTHKRKALATLIACSILGLVTLGYYESQMPKYHVAIVEKELYRVPPQLSKQQLIELGAECNTYGNTLCSHDVFAKVVRLDPRDYSALANLAMAQSHLGFHKEAVTNFKLIIKQGLTTYDIWRFYGNSLLALKNTSEAKKAYSQSLRLNPRQKKLKDKIDNL